MRTDGCTTISMPSGITDPNHAVSAPVVHQPASVFYFSGNENLHVYDNECVVIPAEGEISLLVPQADLSRAHLTSWVPRIFSFPPHGSPAPVLAQILDDSRTSSAAVWSRLREIACPVLLVRGTRSPSFAEATAREMLVTLPHAQLVELDAGHNVALDRPAELADAVLRLASEASG